MERKQLRKEARAARDALSSEERQTASRRIMENVCALPELGAKNSILLYCAFRSEVETAELARRLRALGKTVCVPLCVPETKNILPFVWSETMLLRPGYQGIPEPEPRGLAPFPAEKLDLVFVPGLFFDHQGNRLGYGGGYYDRFLACQAPQALRVGLAFFSQTVAALEAERHDISLDILVTERQVWRWRRI